MATTDDIYAALRNADAAGDSAAVQKLGAYLKSMQQQSVHDQIAAKVAADPITQGALHPEEGIDTAQAGFSKAYHDLKNGAEQVVSNSLIGRLNRATTSMLPASVGNALSMRSPEAIQADIDETKRRDAPLMATTGGKVGNVAGSIAATLPVGFIPGANALTGSALVGGTIGALQPVTSDQGDYGRARNTAVGAATGPLAVLGMRGVNGLYQGGKALIEPLTQAGQERIAGRTLARFAENPNSIAGATSAATITGARPTLAEQTGDLGLARLQDSVTSLDPQISNAVTRRLSENNAARVASLRGLTGEDGGRAFAEAERRGTASPMYDDAFKVVPDASTLSPEQARSMQTLLKSPAVQQAMKDAQTIAKNGGKNVGPSNASGSIEGMHNMKLALDDQIAAATAAGQTNKANSIEAARDQLVALMETMSPEYASARGVYAQMSKPINSMDIASRVAKNGLSAGTDLASGSQVINRNALLRTLSDEPALIRQATGRSNVGNALSDVMTPADENLLRTIAAEADRTGAVAAAGNGPGSATAQRMASQNVLSNLLGPLGSLGDKAAQSTLVGTVLGKPLNLIYSHVAEPKIQQALARAVLDPDSARGVLAAAQKANVQLPPSLVARLTQQAAAPVGAESALSTTQR